MATISSRIRPALGYVAANRRRHVAELADLVRFPTVSAQPSRRADLNRCARWLARHLARIGMREARVLATRGHPAVYAEWLGAPGQPTVLVYGHYDVQPEDPIEAWRSPPFQPQIRGGVLHGRGASDDKGQLFSHVKALESCLAAAGRLPVNVKCLFEGEEEIGSPNLADLVERHRRVLAADIALISDTPMLAEGRPAVTYALRGALAAEITVRGPRSDLHSGLFGGVAPNPLEGMAKLLATLHDDAGRVAVPGFYDDVAPVDPIEHLRERRSSDAELLRIAGARAVYGEPGFSAHELVTVRPALSVNGVTGGYHGLGPKSVIPSVASAKISARLVPHQDPRKVHRRIAAHIASVELPGLRAEVRPSFFADPVEIDRRAPPLQAAGRAYEGAFGRPPLAVRSGGTVPAASIFARTLGATPVLMGFALPEDHVHGPNEGFSLQSFAKGIEASIRFLHEVAKRRLPAPR